MRINSFLEHRFQQLILINMATLDSDNINTKYFNKAAVRRFINNG